MSTIQMNPFQNGLRVTIGTAGLTSFVIGVLILLNLGGSGEIVETLLAVVIAAWALFVGLGYLGNAIFSRSIGGWARTGYALLGALFVIGALIMLFNVLATGLFVIWLVVIIIGVLWILEGIMAFTVLGEARSKVWTVIYAIISIIAGLVVVFSPLFAAAALWLLVGLSLVVLGVVQIVRAFGVKTEEVTA